MEEQEVLKPVFATYPPYNILNALHSGAIQEIKGHPIWLEVQTV